jgi:hypothetical protein
LLLLEEEGGMIFYCWCLHGSSILEVFKSYLRRWSEVELSEVTSVTWSEELEGCAWIDMENMEDFCVSHNYTQRNLLLPPSSSSSSNSRRHRPPPPPPQQQQQQLRKYDLKTSNILLPCKHQQ